MNQKKDLEYFGYLVFDPSYLESSLDAEIRTAQACFRLVTCSLNPPDIDPEQPLQKMSLGHLDEIDQIVIKCLLKGLIASHWGFQENSFNENVLHAASTVLGNHFFVGAPHLRLHLPKDRSEESRFHSDCRKDSGITLTNWTPLYNPLESQRLLFIPHTHRMPAYSKFTGKGLHWANRFKSVSKLMAREVHIKRKETLLFSAKLWHRGNLNIQENCFLSRVVRMSQHPFAEQGYASVTVEPNGKPHVKRGANYLSINDDEFRVQQAELATLIQGVQKQARALANDPIEGLNDSDFFSVLETALVKNNHTVTTLEKIQSLIWSETAIYLNSSAKLKDRARLAALKSVSADPTSGAALSILLGVIPAHEPTYATRLFEVLTTHLRAAEPLAVAANHFESQTKHFSSQLRLKSHTLDRHYPISLQQATESPLLFSKNQ